MWNASLTRFCNLQVQESRHAMPRNGTMNPVTRARQYKSRSARPCDFCRGRKSACHMERGPPCQLCRERQRPCTFLQAPTKRNRLNNVRQSEGYHADGSRLGHRHSDEGAVAASAPPAGPAWSTERLDHDHDPATLSVPFSPGMGLGPPTMTVAGLAGEPYASDGMPAVLMNRSINYLDENLNFLLSTHDPSMLNIEPLEGETALPNHFVPDQSSSSDTSTTPACQSDSRPAASPPSGAGRSLDDSPGVSYRVIGATGDLDLYVLSHRNYDDNDESSVRYRGLRYRRMSMAESLDPARANEPPTVFTVIDENLTNQASPSHTPGALEEAKKDFSALVSPKLAYRLTLLYAHYVHPHFPILSARQFPSDPEETSSMPVALLAGICATAIPFTTYDDVLSLWLPNCPSSEALFRLTWTFLTQELDSPRLSTIQACLLLLQAHTTNIYLPSTPFRPTLMTTTVTLNYCLGLHRDPSRWTSMPIWERKLRKRIWWATWTMEKWISLGESIPSSLKDEDSDVEPLEEDDLKDELPDHLETQPSTGFCYLVSLTSILTEVVDTFFTVKATARTAQNIHLSLELAKSLRAKLKQWHDKLPAIVKRQITAPGSSLHDSQAHRQKPSSLWNLESNGSFHLAYLTVQLTLFRALLRPVSTMASTSTTTSPAAGDVPEVESAADQIAGPKAIIKGAMVLVEEVVEFAENLDGSEWDAFWHSWSRSNFAIASGVMLILLMILRPSMETQQGQILLENLRKSAKSSKGGAGPEASSSGEPGPPGQPNTDSFLNLQNDYTILLDYLTRWRWAMKVASRGAGGRKGLMNLALLRMDALLVELTSTSSADEDNGTI